MYEIQLTIDGMMCSMCESHINDAIRRTLPVKKVTSSHKRGTATLLSEEALTEDACRAALEPTGYELLSWSCKPQEKKRLFPFGK